MTAPSAADVEKLLREMRSPTSGGLGICPDVLWLVCSDGIVRFDCKGDQAEFLATVQRYAEEHI